MSSEHYRTIARSGTNEIVIKKSRFICTLTRAATEEEARDAISAVRKEHWNANHNCTAYRLGPDGMAQRSNDDGEPSGTAGLPMLEVLRKRDITDTVAVVTRYFGGVMLGAGGLIRAYGQAVSDAIDAIGLVERRELAIMAVHAGYDIAGPLENALHTSEYTLDNADYGAEVTFEIPLEPAEIPAFEAWLGEATSGAATVTQQASRHIEVPI